jgi:FkbM family methyltransferase
MLLSKVLPRIGWLHRFSREYCDCLAGENNDDMNTNGELFFLEQHIRQCKVVFDVGANKGDWTNLVLGLNPSADIHCFEPIQGMFAHLKNRNFPINVHCNHAGLSSEKGSRDIFLGAQSLYARTGLKAGWGIESAGDTEKIELLTIDEYCRDKHIVQIDFLKCDVEGHEYAVFQGAKNMLENERISRIQFEYGGCNIDARVMLKDIFELFSGGNYTFYKLMPRQLVKIDEYDQRLENYTYKNFAILHKSINA